MTIAYDNDGYIILNIPSGGDNEGKILQNIDTYIACLNDPAYAISDINPYGCVTNTQQSDGFYIATSKNTFGVILGHEFNPFIYRGENKYYEHFIPSAFRYDLSQENEQIKVALFFAYTEYKNGKYYPIEDFSKYETPPVLYTANYYELLFFEDKMLQPVGFQAALRPQMQKAMALNIGLNSDAYKHFIKTQLKPNKKFAEWIYNYFDGGKALFPDEPVQVLRNMVVNKVELTKSLFYKYCQIYKVDSKVLSEELINAGYIITDFKIEINADLKKSIEEDIYQRILPWLKTHIFCRKVKLPKENEEHMYIQMFPELPKI